MLPLHHQRVASPRLLPRVLSRLWDGQYVAAPGGVVCLLQVWNHKTPYRGESPVIRSLQALMCAVAMAYFSHFFAKCHNWRTFYA